MESAVGPLHGIRVLEWATWHQGAAGAGVLLGDLGAEVIKIEEPGGGDTIRGAREMFGVTALLPGGHNMFFEVSNRNKKSIALNLKHPKAREIVYRLVRKCDVFTTNFRPSVALRMGLDYQTLSRYNPRLIYANTTGYGVKGPYAERRAYDWIGLAHSGLMTATGERELPPQPIVGMTADQTGALTAAYGILAALVARERLGVGQEVRTSMLNSMLWLQYINISTTLLRGKSMRRASRTRAPNPLANYYRCADGRWLMLCHVQSDRFWGELCRAIGRPELEKDPRFEDMEKRRENREELISLLDEVFASRPREEWLKIFAGYDLIYSPINNIEELTADPQIQANEFITEFPHPVLGPVKVLKHPVEFSQTPAHMRSRAPELGEHTEEVLSEIGEYTWEEISRFREEGVI